jgi:hypothetical protein
MAQWWVIKGPGWYNVAGPASRAQAGALAKSSGASVYSGPYASQAAADAHIPAAGAGSAPPPVHTLPGYTEAGPWYINSDSGELTHATGFLGWLASIDAKLPLDWYGFKTRADAVSAAAIEGWPAPTTSTVTGLKNAAKDQASDAEKAASSTVPGLSQIGGFFSRLSQANTWIRLGEVLLGLVLIAIGLARMTNAIPLATKVAKAAGTAAIP